MNYCCKEFSAWLDESTDDGYDYVGFDPAIGYTVGDIDKPVKYCPWCGGNIPRVQKRNVSWIPMSFGLLPEPGNPVLVCFNTGRIVIAEIVPNSGGCWNIISSLHNHLQSELAKQDITIDPNVSSFAHTKLIRWWAYIEPPAENL